MFPLFAAIPLLAMLMLGVLYGEMNPSLREPQHAVVVVLSWAATTYLVAVYLVEDSRELS